MLWESDGCRWWGECVMRLGGWGPEMPLERHRKAELDFNCAFVGGFPCKSLGVPLKKTLFFENSAPESAEYELPVSHLPGAPVQVHISRFQLSYLD